MLVIVRIYGDFDDFGRLFDHEKQTQTKPVYLAPRIFWGFENQFEKTKPIYRSVFCVLRAAKTDLKKQSQFVPA
jgi:hypothetical protein